MNAVNLTLLALEVPCPICDALTGDVCVRIMPGNYLRAGEARPQPHYTRVNIARAR